MIIELVSIPVVTAVCEAIKKTGKVSSKYMPLTSIVVGVVAGVIGYAVYKETGYIATGLIAGLAGSGLYDVAKAYVPKKVKE